MCSIFSWIKYLAVVSTTVSLVSGHGRMIDPPQRSSLWRDGWEVTKNYEDHSLNCGGYWHQWGEMDGKCGVCGDPYDSDRPNEAGGRYANGIIARTYGAADEFMEVTIEVTASIGGYFEFRLCPHNNINKPVKQSCLDQYPLRIEGSGRRLYPDLPLGKNGFVFAKLHIPLGVTCNQCVLQWKWHGGNHWGMCTNGIGLVGCGPQTEIYNCADIAILRGASSRDNKPTIKPRLGIPKQNSSSSLTNRKAPSVRTVITKTTTVTTTTTPTTRRDFRSEATTWVPSATTQNNTSTTIRTKQEYTSRQWFTPTIRTNSLAINSSTTSQSIPTTTYSLSILDNAVYQTTMKPLEAKSATTESSSDILSSNIISAQEIGEIIDNGLPYQPALPTSAHNFTSAREQKISITPDTEFSTTKTRSTSISTSMWTPMPTKMTAAQSTTAATNTMTTTTAATTRQPTTTTTKTTTATQPASTTTQPATRPTTVPLTTTTTAEQTTQSPITESKSITQPKTTTTTSQPTTTPSRILTTTTILITAPTDSPKTSQPMTSSTFNSTQLIKTFTENPTTTTTEPATRPTAVPLTTTTTTQQTTTQPLITEPKSITQPKTTTTTSQPTTTPARIFTTTSVLIPAPTDSPKTSQPMTSSTFNSTQLIETFTENPTTTTTKASTTTIEIPQTTTVFQTTKKKEATLPTVIKSTTKTIDKPIVRGSASARRASGLSVATLFPFDLTRNLIDPSNSGINTEIKSVRRGGSNSLFDF